MSNQFLKLRRSSIPGKVPTTASLEFGEIALNTYDGLAFIKKSGSNGEEIVTIGATSGSFTGSLFGTASWAENSLTSSYSLNIDGQQYYIATFNGSNSLTSSTIYQSGSYTSLRYETIPEDPQNPEILYVAGYGVNTYNLISAHTDYDNYAQLNVKNYSSGPSASSDIVATNNIGSETSYYINMGINGDGYNIDGGIGSQNDSYLYSLGENLLIGNASEGKKVIIFNGTGSALESGRVFILPEGTVGINAQDNSAANPEALLVEPIFGASNNPNDFGNLIIAKAEINENYAQTNIKNLGTGSLASADVVATNDIGTETNYYIDMGINSSGYNTPNAVGMANDAYLYSTGEHLHIGNASAGMPIVFFAGGLDSEANRKLELWPDNQHQMSGSLSITGSLTVTEGITGSLYGTASWALNTLTASFVQDAVSASYALTASYAIAVSGTIENAVSASYAGTASWAINAITASFITLAQTASYIEQAQTASYVLNAVSSSFSSTASFAETASYAFYAVSSSLASTASYVLNAVSAAFATNAATASSAEDFVVRGTLTGSDALFTGTITAQRLNVQYITSSTEFITGSTKFGSQLTDTHQFTGSVSITGSLTVAGPLNATSSWATNALTASYVQTSQTASYVLQAVSASFASTASYVQLAQTASFVATASWAQNATTASYILNAVSSSFASTASFVNTAQTASYILNAVSSSFASTASFVTTAQTASFVATASWAQNSITASYVLNAVSSSFASTASYVQLAQTASFVATASWANNSVTASYVTASSVFGPFGSNSVVSASYALTASYAQNAATASYILASGVVGLSLNQITTGSVTASVNVNSASFQLVSASTQLLFVSNSGLITGQRLFLSSSRNMATGSTLVVYGSGSAQPVFTVQGSQGELFSVTDSLSGSLFSVNDISGLPIIEAFSDNRVLIGSYQAPMLTTTLRTTLAVGNNIIFQNVPTASYDAVFFEYSLKSGSNSRAGSIMSIWSGSEANFTEVVTMDYGNTSGVKLMVMVTGSNVALTGSATTANWTMKTIVRAI